MTIAIYQPIRIPAKTYTGAHRMHHKSFKARLSDWLRYLVTGETVKVKPYEGATEITPVIDPEIVTDPFDSRWRAIPGDDVQPFIGEWVEAQYHAEHGRPLDVDCNHNWATSFTDYYQAIGVPTEDEQLALPVGSTQ